MKVTIDIPLSKVRGYLAIANMDGTLTDEQMEEIANTPEVDITDIVSKSSEAASMEMGIGLFAIVAIGEKKWPDL